MRSLPLYGLALSTMWMLPLTWAAGCARGGVEPDADADVIELLDAGTDADASPPGSDGGGMGGDAGAPGDAGGDAGAPGDAGGAEVADAGAAADAGAPDAGTDAGGAPDAGPCELEARAIDVAPGPSCAGLSNLAVVISGCGCPEVTIRGAFYDTDDGSGGQVVGRAASGNCFRLTWDDREYGGDCDLDIAHEICVDAQRTDTQLVLDVTNTILANGSSNYIGAGYQVSGVAEPILYARGSETETFAADCAP